MKRTIITPFFCAIFATLFGFLAEPAQAADPAPVQPAAKEEVKAAGAKPSENKEAPAAEGELKLAPGKAGLSANTNTINFTNLYMRASYVLGVQNAATLMMDGGELLIPELVIRGMQDVFAQKMPLITQQEAEEILQKFTQAVQEADVEKKKREAAETKEKGIKFLEENAKKEGIKVTDSGLQYKVLQEGKEKGLSPTEDDRVSIHFRARNVDGIEFANSYKHKAPVPAIVRSQIKAFREALVLMKEGEKRELYVPSELAYGKREVGKGIGPNSALIFELELVKVEKNDSVTEAKK